MAKKLVQTEIQFPKIRNRFNNNDAPRRYETNTLPHLTLPDQTMSVKTILERYARGLSVDTRQPIYEGDHNLTDGVDIRKLDIEEKYQAIQKVKDFQKETRSKIQESRKKVKNPLPSQNSPLKEQELPFDEE